MIALTLSLLCFAGCGGSPAASLATVVFMGDSITANWSSAWAGPTFVSQTNWINKGGDAPQPPRSERISQ